jgi:hypothetical protein
MSKLIAAHLANPTDKTRARLTAYLASHPFAVCLASPEQLAVINSLN